MIIIMLLWFFIFCLLAVCVVCCFLIRTRRNSRVLRRTKMNRTKSMTTSGSHIVQLFMCSRLTEMPWFRSSDSDWEGEKNRVWARKLLLKNWLKHRYSVHSNFTLSLSLSPSHALAIDNSSSSEKNFILQKMCTFFNHNNCTPSNRLANWTAMNKLEIERTHCRTHSFKTTENCLNNVRVCVNSIYFCIRMTARDQRNTPQILLRNSFVDVFFSHSFTSSLFSCCFHC